MELAQSKRRGGRAHHSVLAPHIEAIRQWRRQRRSWREIAELLAAEKGVQVTLYAAYRFMRRQRARAAHWEDGADAADSSTTRPEPQEEAPAAAPARRPTPPALPSTGFQRPNPKSFKPDEYL